MGKRSSFFYLNATNCLITLNDAIFRLIVTYSLIDTLGVEYSNTILSVSATLFILPFLFFTYSSGQLADKFSKNQVIIWTMWAELFFMFLGLGAIALKNPFFSYFALFLIALQASVFTPVKFAIIPEIEPKERLSKTNGILTLSMYLSIILGTFLATIICDLTNKNYTLVVLVCIAFSLMGIYSGYKIENTPVKNHLRKIDLFFFKDMVRTFKIASEHRYLLLSIFASSYFLFTAAYTQLNLIPFGMQSLGLSDVDTGYIYLSAALGVGIGSWVVGTLSGKQVKLRLSVWGAFGTSFSYIILFFAQHHLIFSVFLFFLVGFNGGLYVVPMDAYIQLASPEKHRGAIVGAGTLMGFIGVLFSAGAIALMGNLFGWQAATGYLVIGLISLMVSCWIFYCLSRSEKRLHE